MLDAQGAFTTTVGQEQPASMSALRTRAGDATVDSSLVCRLTP
ncbi:hypothetical protein [Streptomyces sp. NPDC056944]